MSPLLDILPDCLGLRLDDLLFTPTLTVASLHRGAIPHRS